MSQIRGDSLPAVSAFPGSSRRTESGVCLPQHGPSFVVCVVLDCIWPTDSWYPSGTLVPLFLVTGSLRK